MGMTKEERLRRQRERLVEMKAREAELHSQGYKYVCGVDEVGRGPLAGPVVTAAVVLPEDFSILGVDDSKKLSEKRREALYEEIIDGCIAYGIGMADHRRIDEINILQATKEAMVQAVVECEKMLSRRVGGDVQSQASGDEIRVQTSDADMRSQATGDGGMHCDYIIFDAMKIDDLQRRQESVIKGDSKILAVAAASILAKVTRDRMMVEYSKEYPGYGFQSNKGYGTAEHYRGIREQGTCPIHRLTFLKTIH